MGSGGNVGKVGKVGNVGTPCVVAGFGKTLLASSLQNFQSNERFSNRCSLKTKIIHMAFKNMNTSEDTFFKLVSLVFIAFLSCLSSVGFR